MNGLLLSATICNYIQTSTMYTNVHGEKYHKTASHSSRQVCKSTGGWVVVKAYNYVNIGYPLKNQCAAILLDRMHLKNCPPPHHHHPPHHHPPPHHLPPLTSHSTSLHLAQSILLFPCHHPPESTVPPPVKRSFSQSKTNMLV